MYRPNAFFITTQVGAYMYKGIHVGRCWYMFITPDSDSEVSQSPRLLVASALALAKKVSSGALEGQEVLEFLLSAAAVEKADQVQEVQRD